MNHGKAAPLKRIVPGSRVAYYSPTSTFGGKDKLQAFTAIGVVKPGEPYQGDMDGGLLPFRRDVAWLKAHPAPIQPLLDELEFSAGVKNWGQKFRFGLFDQRSRHGCDRWAHGSLELTSSALLALLSATAIP